MPALLSTISSALPLLLLLPHPTHAHSHLSHILINGLFYAGFDPRPDAPNPNSPSRIAWSTEALDDGFVAPANYSHPDIVCHTGGSPAAAHAPVRPGDRVHVQWNGWPVGHVGPVLSYLARCEGEEGCKGVEKTALRWTKIDEGWPVLEMEDAGAVRGTGEGDGSGEGEGDETRGIPGQKWATDVLVAANNSWQVEIPRGLERGPYVLRHEIVALHYAGRRGGAQNYPLCMNLWVEEGGDDGGEKFELDAYDAMEFYKEDDAGILVNATALTSYVVPGPTVAAGATPVPYEEQRISLSRAPGTPVLVTRSTETVPFTAAATPTPGRVGRYQRRG